VRTLIPIVTILKHNSPVSPFKTGLQEDCTKKLLYTHY